MIIKEKEFELKREAEKRTQEENGKRLAMQGLEYILRLQIDTDK
jgi:hypothetical protein